MNVDKKELLTTLKQFGGSDRVITVHKSFVEFTGSLEAGMMLSQILYWSERDGNRGRFYKSDKEFACELYITQYAVRQARGVLEQMGIIKTEVHRANGTPTLHYFLDEDALLDKWTLWIRKIEIAKTQNQTLRNQQISNREYTESTPEPKFQSVADATEIPVVTFDDLQPALTEKERQAMDERIKHRTFDNGGAAISTPNDERIAFVAEIAREVRRVYKLDDDKNGSRIAKQVAAKIFDASGIPKSVEKVDRMIRKVKEPGENPFFLPTKLAVLFAQSGKAMRFANLEE